MAFISKPKTPDPLDSGRSDPLFWDAVRFASACGQVGPVGLMRRFKIGRTRALFILLGIRDEGFTYRWGHRGIYRLMPIVWGFLQVRGTHAYAPESLGAYRLYLQRHPAYRDVPGWRPAP